MSIVDLNKEKHLRREMPISEILDGLHSHNCDPNRPYIEQQPKRSAMQITGLTRRDIQDCMVLGILDCKDEEKLEEEEKLPRIYLSEQGNLYNDFHSLCESKDDYCDSYLDCSRVKYNDLYNMNMEDIDPVAAVQNMACHLERRLGIYPALQKI